MNTLRRSSFREGVVSEKSDSMDIDDPRGRFVFFKKGVLDSV